jgi:hypothetical protein
VDGEKWTAGGRAAAAAETAKQLPTTRPKGIGHRCWRAAQGVYALTREGSKWIDLNDLLDKVRERIGDKRLSLRTLNKALSWLRKGGFISR